MGYRNYSVSNGFIVDKLGNGDFTTIASALTAATSGMTIFIRPGTYTENLTLKAGVNLTAFTGDGYTGNVIVSGNCTLSTAGTVSISDIELQTNSANCVTVSGSVASILNLINCNINCSNSTGISYTSSSASSKLNLINCLGNLGTTGIALFSSSSSGNLTIENSSFTNSGGSSTANTVSAGVVGIGFSVFTNPTTTSGTAKITFFATNIDTSALNATCLTIGGSQAGISLFCQFVSGTATAITITSSFTLGNCSISSSNANAITGAGTINYAGIGFTSAGVNINTTTQVGGTLEGGTNGNAPSPGFLGEQFRSFVNSAGRITLTNVTPANITSINLTAGIWDVSCLAQFNSDGGAVTGTALIASISTTSATLGTPGDNYINNVTMPNANSDQGLTIPSFRITINTTTTVYLVVQGNFTVGTLKAYGRISATRVG